MPLPELILALLVIVAVLAWAAARMKVPYPIMLVLGGLGLSLAPGLPPVELHPDVVFVLFLPPILFYAGFQTSWRDFRRRLWPISTLAIGLVLFTMCAVALVAHWAIPALPLAAAFVLGAIISPPDSVAPAAIFERLRVPKPVTTILEGESAVNDATALVAYQFAIAAVVSGDFVLRDAGLKFFMVALGGIAVGYAAGRAVMWVRPHLHDNAVESVLSLLTPYIAYLPAEWMHVSGVLSAVTAGIVVSRRLPLAVTSQMRMRAYANWETFIFLLNGLVFILIGLQLPKVIEGLSEYSWAQLIGYAAIVSATAIVMRLLWCFVGAFLHQRIRHAFVQRKITAPPAHALLSCREVTLVGWTGLRGIVSLAAAMALPIVTQTGQAFPGRSLILFITFGVILATLVLQGLTLPAVIRGLRLQANDDEEAREERRARLEAAHAAMARLEALAFTNEELTQQIARVRGPYQERIRLLGGRVISDDAGDSNGDDDDDDDQAFVVCQTIEDIEREALHAERRWIVKLRDDGFIGDDVFRRIQQELDLEESKLT